MNKIIDGKTIALEILNRLKDEILVMKNRDQIITLAIIQVGNDSASLIYKNSKIKKCNELGIKVREYNFDIDVSENEIVSLIHKLNDDNDITGIFVELPLPKNLNSNYIINQISYKKDIEGTSNYNLGMINYNNNGMLPATASACLNILKYEKVDLSGKNIVVMGRSVIVGKPLSMMLLNENATITICHSKTENIKSITHNADILIVSINKEEYVDSSFIKNGAIVIDVGIHRKVLNDKNYICGDVNFNDVLDKVSMITPVPGGVGPITVNMLINNLVISKKMYG